MNNFRETSRDKTVGELGREAFWFLTHTLLAVLALGIVIGLMSITHPDSDSNTPKLIGTVLAFFVSMAGGYLIARLQKNDVARYVWISGLCENCGALDKLWRTFLTLTMEAA